MNDFVIRLQKLMDERHMKATDVAEASKKYDESGKGISKANISQWLNSVYEPKAWGINLLSKVLGCNPNYLMGITDEVEYDHEKLTQQAIICDMINKCYGKKAYEVVKMFLTLNHAGQEAAFERIQELTMLDKYTRIEVEKRAIL